MNALNESFVPFTKFIWMKLPSVQDPMPKKNSGTAAWIARCRNCEGEIVHTRVLCFDRGKTSVVE